MQQTAAYQACGFLLHALLSSLLSPLHCMNLLSSGLPITGLGYPNHPLHLLPLHLFLVLSPSPTVSQSYYEVGW